MWAGAVVHREHVAPARGGTRAWRIMTYRARPGDEVVIQLWPNASPDRPLASEMHINIKPLPVIPPDVAPEVDAGAGASDQ